MRADWVAKWREGGVPADITRKFYELYGVPSEKLTFLMINDDKRIGIGWLSLPYSNQEITSHDLRMLLARENLPIASVIEIQSDFLGGTLWRGVKSLAFAIAAVPVAVVGATVGSVIQIFRKFNR
jgi:hypothetical protein